MPSATETDASMRPAALAADPLVPTVDSQRSLAPRHEASTGTKLSQHAAQRDHPVQNSPRTHKNADFGPLSAHRENLFTLTPITSHAGRTLYRTRGRCRYKTLPAHRPGGITRYKTLPARGPVGPTRYKTLPARPKYPFSAHFEPAGRVLYRFHHHQAEQGEKSHAPTPHLTPVTCPPPIPHAIPKHK